MNADLKRHMEELLDTLTAFAIEHIGKDCSHAEAMLLVHTLGTTMQFFSSDKQTLTFDGTWKIQDGPRRGDADRGVHAQATPGEGPPAHTRGNQVP